MVISPSLVELRSASLKHRPDGCACSAAGEHFGDHEHLEVGLLIVATVVESP